MEKTLRILLTEEGADAEDITELAGYLREELLQLDVDDVTSVPGAAPPPGARAVDVTTIGALLVSLGGSATALNQVLNAIRDWRDRCRGARPSPPSLRLTLDDDVLEISEASTQQVSEAFDLFVSRHSTVGT
ncbi:hypothetical protein OG562_38885 [Streptomyces sp. NBC_01275]|uniref:hypothetical protein n=1 Tax=Streptomyces sp. NBC_01275 TaxID=2903807 RepID=UPI00225C2CE1|nr:hypothetical protein [Streptomyces sp. NBC_01275]MCX4766832.1 hypothetical protein [Streptomyces sp. NBC_01275]